MSVLATSVIDFTTGEAVSGIQVFLDEERHRTADGVTTQFVPGDTIWALATLPDEYRLVKAAVTAGSVVSHGRVSRSQTDQILFAVANRGEGLSRRPSGSASAVWYGRRNSLRLDLEGQTVAAEAESGMPCLADVSYSFIAESFQLSTPTMTLAEDETYPIGLVVYVQEVA